MRPVSDDEGHAISAYYRVVGKNDPALVGDVLRMNLGDHVGENWQSENWEHIPEHWPEHWQRLDTLSYDQVLALADRPTSVWGKGRSTRWGEHDELSVRLPKLMPGTTVAGMCPNWSRP